MIHLTQEQHQAVASDDRQVRDEQSQTNYVLVNEDTYQQLRGLLQDGPLTNVERQTILRGVWQRAHWDDLRMDAYDSLPE